MGVANREARYHRHRRSQIQPEFGLAATAVALAGCARSESATEAAFRADDAKCKEYGADPGSDAYVQCRLAIDLQKGNAEAEAARQRVRTYR
jgi:hypothetical protein